MKVMLFIILILICFLCFYDIPKTGIPQSSSNIKFSKQIGVFRGEYIPLTKDIILNDKKYSILEVWVENSWSYKNIWKEIEVASPINFYILCSELINYSDFKIRHKEPIPVGYDGGKLIVSLEHFPDTLSLNFDDNQKVVFVRKNR